MKKTTKPRLQLKVTRSDWEAAQQERLRTSKILTQKRQAFVNAEIDYRQAKENEEVLYRLYMGNE